jgi:hypothetical protein
VKEFLFSFKSKIKKLKLIFDLTCILTALFAITLAAILWYKPPLLCGTNPKVSYIVDGETFTNALLFRPLAMPSRYYVQLPGKVQGKYQWFAIDRRQEVAAWAEAPVRHFLRWPAIHRSDPLGLDLEFRKIDSMEWNVRFQRDEIVFSNDALTVRLEPK